MLVGLSYCSKKITNQWLRNTKRLQGSPAHRKPSLRGFVYPMMTPSHMRRSAEKFAKLGQEVGETMTPTSPLSHPTICPWDLSAMIRSFVQSRMVYSLRTNEGDFGRCHIDALKKTCFPIHSPDTHQVSIIVLNADVLLHIHTRKPTYYHPVVIDTVGCCFWRCLARGTYTTDVEI